MLSALTTLCLTQTVTLLSNKRVDQTLNPTSFSVPALGASEVDVVYTQAGAARGNMTITATAMDQFGLPASPTVAQHIDPTIHGVTMVLAPFVGTDVAVTIDVDNPIDHFNGVSLSAIMQVLPANGSSSSTDRPHRTCYLPQ